MSFPDLTAAALSQIAKASKRSNDGIVRIELHRHADVEGFIQACDDGRRRFGLTAPFTSVAGIARPRVSRNPALITRWRNEPISARREAPIVIVGYATGRSEAGLRRARITITEQDLVREYRTLAESWLSREVEISGPCRLLDALVDMTLDGHLDVVALEQYASDVFKDPAAAHVRPQEELWRLGLIPDARAMDTRTPGSRLSLNYHTVEFLLSSPDSAADERQLERLASANAAGHETAAIVMAFRRTREFKQLRGVQLDQVLELLRRNGKPDGAKGSSKSNPTISLWDALDRGNASLVDLCRSEAGGWDPVRLEEFEATIDFDDCRVRLAFAPDKEDAEAELKANGTTLWTVRVVGAAEETGTKWTGDELLAAARDADALLESTVAVELTTRFLQARDAVAPLAAWSDHLLAVLILKPNLMELASAYVDAWQSLVTFALSQDEPARVSGLRQYLAFLEGDWELGGLSAPAEQVNSVRLSPLHPFVLVPTLSLARFVESSNGVANLGSQVLWASDRTIPAYPAMWSDSATLVHRQGTSRPIFARKGTRQRPETMSKTGIVDVVKSYLGLNPFACRYLSILFVDPPGGRGIPAAIKTIRTLVADLEVVVVHTDSDAVDWPSVNDVVVDMRRHDSLGMWLDSSILEVSVAFIFQPAKAALAGSHTGEYRPSRGLQNVLTISAAPPPVTATSEHRNQRVPFVSVQPRDANEVVHLMMQLTRAADREDRFFQVEPMLDAIDAGELARVSSVCDWLVVGTPSPIGMIPPRRFAGVELVYLGREDSGAYGFFVYSRDLFSVRRHIERQMVDAPLQPECGKLEDQIERLALSVPNGVLRIGRGGGDITSQVGLMAASALARQ
jgi:hypothetical protein